MSKAKTFAVVVLGLVGAVVQTARAEQVAPPPAAPADPAAATPAAEPAAPAMTEPPAAPPEPPPSIPEETRTEGDEDPRYHKGQLGLHVQPGTGYRVLFPYNEEFCGDVGKSTCTARAPFYLELGASFAFTNSVELVADVRISLEEDFDGITGAIGPKPFSFAAGLRFYPAPDGFVKFFTTVQGVVETTDYQKTTVSPDAPKGLEGSDFGVRNVNGVLLDFHKMFGVYLHFGETVTFVKWMRFELHGGLGLQVRFP